MEDTPPERQIPRGPSDRAAGGHRGDDQPGVSASQRARHALLPTPSATAASVTRLDSGVLLPVTSVETVRAHGPLAELVPSLAPQRALGGGVTKSEQLRGLPQRAALWVPDPQFATKTLTGRQPGRAESLPAPGDQLDPTPRAGVSSIEHLQARGLADECQHVSLPLRSPGTHLHPRLRCTSVTDRCGGGGSRG